MLTPVKPIAFSFTSDFASTSLIIDLSSAPVSLDLSGCRAVGVKSLAVTSALGATQGAAAIIAGSILTLTFAGPLATFDGNGNLVVYEASFLLQLASLTPLA